MRLRFCKITLILLFSFTKVSSQPVYERRVYLQVVSTFYEHLYKKRFTSLKEYYDIFGPYAEGEDWLFKKQCLERTDSSHCLSLERERERSRASSESVVFSKLRSSRELFLSGNHDWRRAVDQLRIIDNLLPSSIDLVVRFPNEQFCVFEVNNVPNEPPYILSIFLTNGLAESSIFGISGGSAYKRLAKTSDKDGLTNVRNGKGTQNPVEFQLGKEDMFFVFPNSVQTWWRVETLDCRFGYIHKSKVKLLGMFSDDRKRTLSDSASVIYDKPPRCK